MKTINRIVGSKYQIPNLAARARDVINGTTVHVARKSTLMRSLHRFQIDSLAAVLLVLTLTLSGALWPIWNILLPTAAATPEETCNSICDRKMSRCERNNKFQLDRCNTDAQNK